MRGTGISVLAVDDNPELLETLVDFLSLHEFSVVTARNGREAIEMARSALPDIAILDVTMPEMDGFEATRHLKNDPLLRFIPIILLTARSDIEAIELGLDAGANDYLLKPFEERELLARISSAIRTRSIYEQLQLSEQRNEQLQESLQNRHAFGSIIGKSPPMQSLYSMISRVALSDVPVFVSGESGSGKELVARAIHFNSQRKSGPFIAQNCAAFQENLLEAEFFGYVRGAFTGALRDHKGIIERADGGTLFLDEIAEMSPALQAKLLRVLQDGTFTPVGDTRLRQANIRIVTASHQKLKKLVEDGVFREDLFYRINVVSLELPPLRSRVEDIPLLAQEFLMQLGIDRPLPAEVLRVLVRYPWPGNVRQLQNEIRRMVALASAGNLSSNDISPEILSFVGSTASSGEVTKSHSAPPSEATVVISTEYNLKEAVKEVEINLISATLRAVEGNRSEAARRLGISRSNLLAKIQALGL